MSESFFVPRRSSGALAALTTVALWGASFPAIHVALRDFDPVPLGALRFAIASAVLCGIALARRRPAHAPRFTGRDLVRVAACAGIGIAAYNALLNTGQTTVSAGAASFITNAQPIIAALLATWLLRERPGARVWIGSIIGFAGVTVIAAAQPGGLQFSGGATLVALAAACSATSFVLQRPLVARHGALLSAAAILLAGALLLSPWLGAGLAQARAAASTSLLAVLFLALASGVLGYLAWMRALDELGAARAANYLYLTAPWAAVLDWLVIGSRPSLAIYGGGAIALAGVALVNSARARGR